MAMEYPAGEDESTSRYLAFINETVRPPIPRRRRTGADPRTRVCISRGSRW